MSWYTVRLNAANGVAETLHVRATGASSATREALARVARDRKYVAVWVLEGRL